jgi:hypothetical protein
MMTTPRNTGPGGSTGLTGTGPVQPPVPPPLDPDEIKQKQLLNEAVLLSFAAVPGALQPFGRAKLAWDITMPTTVLPGVNVEVLFRGVGDDQVVDATATRIVAPYNDHSYGLYLRTPKASRHLGSLDLVVDHAACIPPVNIGPGLFSQPIKDQANGAFPSGGTITVRGNGAAVDIGYNSFVVDIPLKAAINNWFDPAINISIGFSLASEGWRLRERREEYDNLDKAIGVSFDLAKTNVIPGSSATVITFGAADKIMEIAEGTSDGYLYGFVGPEIANRIKHALVDNVWSSLSRINDNVPPGQTQNSFYDLTLTAAEGLTIRFCPDSAKSAQPPAQPTGGGGSTPTTHP